MRIRDDRTGWRGCGWARYAREGCRCPRGFFYHLLAFRAISGQVAETVFRENRELAPGDRTRWASDDAELLGAAKMFCQSDEDREAYLRWLRLRVTSALAIAPTWWAVKEVARSLILKRRLTGDEITVYAPSRRSYR